MIVPTQQCAVHDPHDKFLAMLPSIRLQASNAFRTLDPEHREELTQEVVVNSYCAYVRLASKGKAEVAFATPLALFAIRHVRAGRRVGSPLNVKDITSPYAQWAKGILVEHLGEFDERQGEWKDALVEDKRAGPAETAAARIDFAAWLRSLPIRQRRIARFLAGGETTLAAARMFGLSPGRISQVRRELREGWLRFQGEMLPACGCSAAAA